jgi:hypothetical protein
LTSLLSYDTASSQLQQLYPLSHPYHNHSRKFLFQFLFFHLSL